ncbi:MAG: hypothetical protein FJW35_11605 [Acidobacteria bacterium]|nr:hypothetical protein [Acidobacteriota bacterium]
MTGHDLLIVLGSGTWSRLSERTEEFVANVEQPCDQDMQQLFEVGISAELSPIILTRDEAQNFLPLFERPSGFSRSCPRSFGNGASTFCL